MTHFATGPRSDNHRTGRGARRRSVAGRLDERRAIAVVFFVDGALFASWVSRIPAFAGEAGAGHGTLGLALLAPAVGGLVTMPLIGRLLPGRSSARFCLLAVAALAPAVVLPALAGSVAVLWLALLAVGVTNAVLDVSMNANGVTVERRLGRPVLSSLHALFSFGGCAGAGLGALAAGLGVDPLPHLVAAAVVLGTVGLYAARRLPTVDEELSGAVSGRRPGTGTGSSTRPRRLPPRLLLLGATCFCAFVAEGGAADWSATLIDDDLAGTAALGAVAYAVFSVAMGSGRLLADRLWARVGPVVLLRGSALVAAGGFGAAMAIGTAPVGIAGFAALGLGLSAAAPTLFRAAAAQPGVPTAPALATVTTLGYTGFLAGPPIVGALAELGSLRAACSLFVLTALLVAALAAVAAPHPDLTEARR